VDDPDAPDPATPRMTWVHWLLYNLPTKTSGLPQGVAEADLPAGVRGGLNDWKRTGFGGPCPPMASRHASVSPSWFQYRHLPSSLFFAMLTTSYIKFSPSDQRQLPLSWIKAGANSGNSHTHNLRQQRRNNAGKEYAIEGTCSTK